ncbi:nucleolar and coiled-body phosphoprotein 1-like [Clytia hemisphaerica]|uniref:Srp40 C-terminal domain-containing protein n=1 Tax=Clytia hemisphaerica TaxID=252671 RepID=A0A7M5UYP0_9CNID
MVTSTACVPSDLFSHVYHYLVSNGFTKSAKYFKKETSIDPVHPAGPDLVEIFHCYFQNQKTKEVVEESQSAEEKTQKVEKKKKKKRKAEDENKEIKDAKKLKVESEEQKQEEEKQEEEKVKKADKKSKKEKKKKKKKQESEDEDENSKDAVEETKEEKVETKSDEVKQKEVKQKEVDEEEEEEEDEEITNDNVLNKSQQMKNAPFRRVISEDVFVRNSLRDNSFEAKIGATGDWGERANNDLKFTRGKGFRHEKTKKKRGSYKGGAINTSVNSIKFDDSD